MAKQGRHEAPAKPKKSAPSRAARKSGGKKWWIAPVVILALLASAAVGLCAAISVSMTKARMAAI